MAVKEKITQKDLILHEILKHPGLCGQFIRNIDKGEHEEPFDYTPYQDEFACDFNSHVGYTCGRAVGKTVVLVDLIIWVLINSIFPGDYINFHVPGKVHVEPVFTGLEKQFRGNSVLKHFIQKNKGINRSDLIIRPLTNSFLDCRIAGQTGTGASVVAAHSPFVIVDECIVGTQKVFGKNTEKIISRIKPGDTVLSWNGEIIEEDRVVSVKKTKREQKVLEIGYNSGSIRVGENHKIYTADGYISAKSLSVGDNIFKFKGTRKKSWTDDEISLIKDRVQNSIPVYDIAKELGRTEQSIFHKLPRIGLSVRGIFDEQELSDTQYQIILGSLLGDGHAEFEINRARYRTNHSLKQKEYVDWLYNHLYNITRTKPQITKNGGWGTWNYWFGTLGHPMIQKMGKELYINNKKTVTREYLDKLSPLGLAVWFMDDGSRDGMLSTHSFSEKENEIIVSYLKEKWGIDSKVKFDKKNNLYFIKIRYKHLKKLKEIIEPYVPECMRYKIGDGKYNNEFPEVSTLPNGEDLETLKENKITYIREVNTRSKYLYDLEVEKNHNYFVNGVLTKNSGYYPWGTWVEMQPTVNTFTSGYRVIVAGVPTGLRENNVCYHVDKENSSFTKHNISAYENPRFTEEDEQKAIETYGGKDNDDFIHLVLGRHGKPVFALFDRNSMQITSKPVYKLTIDGIKLHSDIGEYYRRLSVFPGLSSKDSKCIFGIDLGYTEPTAIVILVEDSVGRLNFHGRIRLNKVNYYIQEKIIDWLDTKFDPMIIGIDEGSAGKAVIPRLKEHEEFSHKDFNKKIIPINFSSTITLGTDTEGNEIKSKTKPFSVGVLQNYTNNHKIVYSSTDLEMVTELERMTYSKTPSGDIVYRTLTQTGGKKGEDHFTAALLCGALAYYLEVESMDFRPRRKKLAKSQWFIGG